VVEFDMNPESLSSVTVVTIGLNGTVIETPAVYDSARQRWVATRHFGSADAPTSVGVRYIFDAEIVACFGSLLAGMNMPPSEPPDDFEFELVTRNDTQFVIEVVNDDGETVELFRYINTVDDFSPDGAIPPYESLPFAHNGVDYQVYTRHSTPAGGYRFDIAIPADMWIALMAEAQLRSPQGDFSTDVTANQWVVISFGERAPNTVDVLGIFGWFRNDGSGVRDAHERYQARIDCLRQNAGLLPDGFLEDLQRELNRMRGNEERVRPVLNGIDAAEDILGALGTVDDMRGRSGFNIASGITGIVGGIGRGSYGIGQGMSGNRMGRYLDSLDRANGNMCRDPQPRPGPRPRPAPPPNGGRRSARPIIDPAGYVYEAVPSNRLTGVTVTCFGAGEDFPFDGDAPTRNAVELGLNLWNATDYDQVNPLLTNHEGRFAWDVPPGWWQVRAEMSGFETAFSEWMPVPPIQLNVNIGMINRAAPTVESVNAYPDAVEIAFGRYMDVTTLTPENITVTLNGTAVSGEIIFVNLEHSIDPTSEYVTYLDAYFASVIRFVPSTPLQVGDSVQIAVRRDVRSYADTRMASNFTRTAEVKIEPTAITAADIEIGYGESGEITVRVLPEGAAEGQRIVAASDSPFVVAVADSAVIDADGNATIAVTGELPGSANITLTLEGTLISKEIAVTVSMPSASGLPKLTRVEASVESRTEVPAGTLVELFHENPDAAIYFTTDESCPRYSSTRIRYTEPILVDEDIFILALAYADGFEESDVRSFLYTVSEAACDCGDCDDCGFLPTCDCGDCEDCGYLPICDCGDCAECGFAPICDCRNCDDCGYFGGVFGLGNVRGRLNADGTRAEPEVHDAIQILRNLVELPSIFDGSVPLQSGTLADAVIAANITRRGNPAVSEPQVHDAIQILRSLVELPNGIADLTMFPVFAG
jgi:hypothetical protein